MKECRIWRSTVAWHLGWLLFGVASFSLFVFIGLKYVASTHIDEGYVLWEAGDYFLFETEELYISARDEPVRYWVGTILGPIVIMWGVLRSAQIIQGFRVWLNRERYA